MINRLIAVFLIFFVFGKGLKAQNYATQRSRVFVTNVFGNAIMGGIGGAINKNKDEKVYKAFFRNFFKGAMGGLVKYTAKYQVFHLNTNPMYATFNRLYFFLGHSMVVNSSLNRKILDSYTCNFYGVDLKVDLKAEQKIRPRISLATLGSAVFFGLSGYEFDLYRTLTYGNLFFNARHSGYYFGKAVFNCIAIETQGNQINNAIVPHEIIHTYQLYDFFSISSFYHKSEKTFFEKKKIYNRLSNYLVVDYEALFFSALYLAQPEPRYYKNYFEFEAEHFKIREYIVR